MASSSRTRTRSRPRLWRPRTFQSRPPPFSRATPAIRASALATIPAFEPIRILYPRSEHSCVFLFDQHIKIVHLRFYIITAAQYIPYSIVGHDVVKPCTCRQQPPYSRTDILHDRPQIITPPGGPEHRYFDAPFWVKITNTTRSCRLVRQTSSSSARYDHVSTTVSNVYHVRSDQISSGLHLAESRVIPCTCPRIYYAELTERIFLTECQLNFVRRIHEAPAPILPIVPIQP